MSYDDLSVVTLHSNNLEQQHICCALSDNKSINGVARKKALMNALFDRGYKFRKLNVQGKVFIEYMPAEIALRPVIAPGYWFIQCLWVSGKYKGHGLSNKLLNECMTDAKKSNGVVVVTSQKPFLNDKKFFLHHGFELSDQAPPHFELMVKKFTNAPDPQFSETALKNKSDFSEGVFIEYTDQCPFTDFYVKLLENISADKNIPFKTENLDSTEKIQRANSAYGTFSLFYKGTFKTHVIPTEKQYLKMLT